MKWSCPEHERHMKAPLKRVQKRLNMLFRGAFAVFYDVGFAAKQAHEGTEVGMDFDTGKCGLK